MFFTCEKFQYDAGCVIETESFCVAECGEREREREREGSENVIRRKCGQKERKKKCVEKKEKRKEIE